MRRRRACAACARTGRVARAGARGARPTDLHGSTGIAHTRWATHGAPTEHNAHPHVGQRRDRAWCTTASSRTTRSCAHELQARGYVFAAQTDTEVIAHLIHHYCRRSGDLLDAVQQAVARAARRLRDRRDLHARAAPRGRRAPGLARWSSARRRRELPRLRRDGAGRRPTRSSTSRKATSSTCSRDGVRDRSTRTAARGRARSARRARARRRASSSGPYRHYMQKEIFEQPRADRRHARGAIDGGISPSCSAPAPTTSSRDVDSVLILACGTSYYAGLVAQATGSRASRRFRASVEIASEYRYRDSVPQPDARWSSRSRSRGETADTLAALKHAQALGMPHTLADLQRRRPARWCAHASWPTSRAPASRSASPRPRPSRPSWSRCSC